MTKPFDKSLEGKTPAERWVWKRMHEVPQDENFQINDLLDAYKAGDANRVSELRELLEKRREKHWRDAEKTHQPLLAEGAAYEDKELLAELGPLCERAPAEKTASDSRQEKRHITGSKILSLAPTCPKKEKVTK